jgi:hypothetical protein
MSHAGQPFEYPEVGEHLGRKVSIPEVMSVRYNNRRKREMSNSLRLMFRAGSVDNGLQPNESIALATGRKPRQKWNGPVVVLRNQGNKVDPSHYDDITLHDYRQAIDHLFWFKTDTTDKELNHNMKKTQGVRINCVGDCSHFKVGKYVSVEVPGEHLVYRVQMAPMSIRMGIPLQVMSYPLNPKWKDTFGAWDSPSATYMYLVTEPSSPLFGFAPAKWQTKVGSVLVVRVDRIPLTPEQTHSLCEFFQFEMSPYFEDALGVGYTMRTKEQALGFLTRKRFQSSFNELRGMMVSVGYLNWSAESKSPYEMDEWSETHVFDPLQGF